MDNHSIKMPPMARRVQSRRAMSLLELTLVVSLLGILSLAIVGRYGGDKLGNGGAEGYARKLALSLNYARRSTILTGDNHFLQLAGSGGNVTSYVLIRRASGGDTQVDQTRAIPADVTVTVTPVVSDLEFDFEGSALGAYSITVAGPDRSWSVTVVELTGAVLVAEIP